MSDYLQPTFTPMSIESLEMTPEVMSFLDKYIAQELRENIYKVFELSQNQYATFEQRVGFFRNLWLLEGPPELSFRMSGMQPPFLDNTVSLSPPQSRWELNPVSALALAMKLEPEAAQEAGRQVFQQTGVPFPDCLHFPGPGPMKQPVFSNTTQWDAPVQPPILAGQFDWLSPPAYAVKESLTDLATSLPWIIPEEPEPEAEAATEAEALSPPESASPTQTIDDVLFGAELEAVEEEPEDPASGDEIEPLDVQPTMAAPFTPTPVVLGNGATSSHPRRSLRIAQSTGKRLGRSYSLA